MQFKKIDEIKPNDKLISNVYLPDGRILLREGVILTERLIFHMQKINLNGVYIEDKELLGVKIDDGLGEDFRLKSIQTLKITFEEIAKKNTFNPKPLFEITNMVVDIFLSKPNFIFQSKDMRTEENFIFSHSINVCMLSVLTAKALGYNAIQLKEVAMGSLLHDIGYAVKGMKEPHTEHTFQGFELLRKQHQISLKSSHMALQHHEMINGLGFPRNIKGQEFIEYAQICAVANEFDHYINHPKDNNLPHTGIEYIMSKAHTHYDLNVVQAFVQNTAPYPIGTRVILNNNQKGLVKNVLKGSASRPLIKLENQQEVDLNKNMTLFVKEVLN
jgi:HD-GYP domain-containing protein (c-di-GMP phosphodiesterase class II)